MALPAEIPLPSPEGYLRWEAGQEQKHEHAAVAVFAMGGASRRHVDVVVPWERLFRNVD